MKQKQPKPEQTREQEQTQEKTTQDRILKTAIANRWKVKLKLTEGEEITGIPQVFEPYSLTILTEDSKIILLYEHAMKYVEPVLP